MTQEELVSWANEQFVAAVTSSQPLRMVIRRVVKRSILEGRRLQSVRTSTRDVGRDQQGMSRRNTSGVTGVAPLFEKGVQTGWNAYYQKNGSQMRMSFRFSVYGDAALAKAINWRKRGIAPNKKQRKK